MIIKRLTTAVAAVVLAVPLFAAQSGEPVRAATTFDLYLAEQGGSDANGGQTFGDAIRTMERAHEILHQVDPDQPVRILIQGGDYHCRGMRGEPWTYFNGNSIEITSMHSVPSPASESVDHADRPRFIGVTETGSACPGWGDTLGGSIWMGISHPRIETNLAISNLQFEKYRGAIRIYNPDQLFTYVQQNNSIVNNVFLRVGDMYHPSSLAGKGAILLHYTYGTEIADNYFRHIRNGSGTAGLIHGIYMTHVTMWNRVENNIFHGSSGAHVKISNYSNYNEFIDNTFMYAPAGIIERFCGTRSDDPANCPGGISECPSWGNVVDSNNVFHQLDFFGVGVYAPNNDDDCGRPAPAHNKRMSCEGVPKVIYGLVTDNCYPS